MKSTLIIQIDVTGKAEEFIEYIVNKVEATVGRLIEADVVHNEETSVTR